MDLGSPVEIAGVQFGNRLMNGAYIGSKTFEQVAALSASRCGAVVAGSITIEPRRPNPGQGYWEHRERLYSLNSFGMPNGGLPYFTKYLPRMVEMAHARSKLLIANVAGFSNDEWATLVRLAKTAGADMVELNFGCPNVWEDGKQERIVSYYADTVHDILAYLRRHAPRMPLIVKISPLPPDTLLEVTQVISASGAVDAVTATNSYPSASTSTSTDTSDEHALAGLSGRSLKPISLGVVRQLRGLLPDDIAIIGCGGIISAKDAADYIAAGATAVQIATGLVDEGPSLFEKLLYQAAA